MGTDTGTDMDTDTETSPSKTPIPCFSEESAATKIAPGNFG